MDKTKQAVLLQATTMECAVFEIGLFHPDAKPMMLPRVWDHETLLRSVSWLKHQNWQGRNIYIRPHGEHHLTLVDDLKADGIKAMGDSGFEPALIVETSPKNYQAWLRHPTRLTKELGTAAAHSLARQFGGDTGAADWRHFGRLAGFTNRKAKYSDPMTGLHPYVRIIEASGQVYSNAKKFLSDLQTQWKHEYDERQRTAERWAHSKPETAAKSIEQFRADAKYLGDNTRIDLAYAVYALSHGSDPTSVCSTLKSRDLSHKGNARRQNEYVERTVFKALKTVHGLGRE
ncbi:MAG TPA: RepB family DNA primase [Bryobacteraceae bacterium]|nr:RepB family DNA primase [Bryobacteraceae bacterium]